MHFRLNIPGFLLDQTLIHYATIAFRFLRQPSKPNAPRPVAKSGRAAGSGVSALTVKVQSPGKLPEGLNIQLYVQMLLTTQIVA